MKNQIIILTLALLAPALQAATVTTGSGVTAVTTGSTSSTGAGLHNPSNLPGGGTYNGKGSCVNKGDDCINTVNEGSGFIPVWGIALIAAVIITPLLCCMCFCCFSHHKHSQLNNDDHFERYS